MCDGTTQNTITRLVGTTPIAILGSSPRRKAFILSPVAQGVAGGSLIAVVFGPGLDQTWTVPAGVTAIVDSYVWGDGGNGGTGAIAVGNGGGGGGGFDNSGPQPAVAGQTWTVNVQAGGSGGLSTSVINHAAVKICNATGGASAAADVGGAGGVGTIGTYPGQGGAGGTTTLSPDMNGAGGGGAAGSFSPGGAGIEPTGGAGGGTATQLTYGQGGAGGAGGVNTFVGLAGVGPGGGGGGGGNGAAGGNGAPGMAIIFYQVPATGGPISLSHRSDVVPGVGILNYLAGQTFPTLITDDDVGSIIQDEWYIVSGANGVPVQITEYLYDPDA